MARKVKIIIVFFSVLYIAVTTEGLAVTEPILEITSQLDSIEYAAADLKDPFQTARKPKEATPQLEAEEPVSVSEEIVHNLVIQGIVWGVAQPQAIINNKVVKIGDTIIEGASITKIDKEGIVILVGNQEYSLPSPANLNTNLKNINK